MWILPFTYVWFMKLLAERKSAAHVHQAVPQQDKIQEQPFTTQGVAALKGSKAGLLAVLFALATVVQWLMSIGVVGLHFRYSWSSRTKHPTYLEVERAIKNPSSLGDIPQACLELLQKATGPALRFQGIHDKQSVQMIHAAIVVVQFILCTVIVGSQMIGKRSFLSKLKFGVAALLVTLALPAIGTGAWIAAKGDQDTYLTYTTNSTLTGGCTFGAVNMNKQWGYWDVQHQLPSRIVLSILGVA